VRRAIHVVVRANQLAILPDGAPVQTNAISGRVVPMEGDTVLAIDDFVEEVKAEIDGWGIAGENLYWRPVVHLTIGPDGHQRAADLQRLLKNSGLELKAEQIATQTPTGVNHGTR
jgi:hypothetical protein